MLPRFVKIALWFGIIQCAIAQSAPIASGRAETVLASLPEINKVDQVSISPDGNRVAFVSNGELSLGAVSGGAAKKVSIPDQLTGREVAWSADSKHVALVADHKGDVPEADVLVVDEEGTGVKKLADLKGYVQAPRFSPDGKMLSLLFIEGMPRVAGPLQPMTPLAGVIEEKFYEQRITTIDLDSGALKQATPGDMYIYEYDWMPDSKGWAAIAAKGSGDNNWWIASLYTADSQSGQMREIYKPKLQIAFPRVSSDGKTIAFIEGLMSDAGLTGGDVHVVPSGGGAARNLTPGVKYSPSTLDWTGPDTITFGAHMDGNSGFARVKGSGGAVQKLWDGPEFLTADTSGGYDTGASFSRDGSVSAVIRQSGAAPPEVWAGPIGQWKQITSFNANVKPAWGELKNVHWMNGQTRVQGWLMLPKDYDPKKKYPLVVTVHGGPSWACVPNYDPNGYGEMSAMGYFALCPNPRGSYGQGEAYAQGNVKDFGGGDFKDIMAGIDTLAKQYPIDLTRLGIRGHSYGGYMTMWAETQTTRFKAAVAGAGLADWLSYYGQNDIDQWMLPFFGASVYDDPQVYAKSDPIHFVKNVKTPTLIIVGDRDGEVPMPQSLEWWHALKALNVPTELVVYPNEGHAFRPADMHDYQRRTMEWFDQWFNK